MNTSCFMCFRLKTYIVSGDACFYFINGSPLISLLAQGAWRHAAGIIFISTKEYGFIIYDF